MAIWHNESEMLHVMKTELYSSVIGDILDQMGYTHQFLPAAIRPLASQVPTALLCGAPGDNWMKLAGYACTVLENDVFGAPKKPFGYMTEALDQLRPNEIYVATGAHNSALWLPRAASARCRRGARRGRCRGGRLYPRYAYGARAELPGILLRHLGAGFLPAHLRL